ncbi:porin family protein [Sphingomonas baiyangensis]|uniref:TonB-dependent receptor n=1 Tax=Sphingomonas baiyangensis TaxID=2572576 RepID=A0A4U1L8I2_9SPHN|nr:TonB-dependent receptor [Sphingomonas baiyangensis]TKD53282.1 TonB-dependent receptor [Sphingomonas baiyangensis]
MPRFPRTATALWLVLLPGAALAQQAPPEPPEVTGAEVDAGETEAADEIVVTGARERGAVIGDVPPEQQLSPADIRAYGVSSVAELLEELSPQTGSGRGRGGEAPVVLLEGRRIGSFREIRELPTEAILRVDILPEEVALKYGYSANQRVVNFVLRPRFRAITVEVEGNAPTDGGTASGEAEVNYLRINRLGRLNVELEVEAQSALTEAERDLVPDSGGSPFDLAGNVVAARGAAEIDPALSALAGTRVTVAPVTSATPGLADFAAGANIANVTDVGAFRTLRPSSQSVRGNAVLARTIFGDVAATATLGFDFGDSRALLGLPGIDLSLPATSPFSPFGTEVRVLRAIDALGPLLRETQSREVEAAISANGNAGDWRWTLTGNYTRNQTDTETDRSLDLATLQAGVTAGGANPFGALPALALLPADTARSVSNVARVDGVANGDLFALPAGDVSTSVRLGLRSQSLDSRSVRAGLVQTADIGRRSANAQVNLDLPITSRRAGVLDAIGDLSLNANAEVDRLSDFGTLTTLGYGLNWSPIRALRLIASVSHEEGAPSPQQVGNPVIQTPNVRVFDFVNGETVDVTLVEGGNPGLRADNRDVFKLGANLRPFDDIDLSLRADYTSSTIRDLISGFPTATAEIEAAFPDRFTRDPAGRLIEIDNRPVNFARSERSQIRYGFNLSLPITGTLQRRAREVREAGGDPRAVYREAYGLPERGNRRREQPPAEGAATPEGQARAAETAEAERPRRGRGGGGGFGRFGGGRGGAQGGGRFQFSAFHTVRLTETILIRDGLPELDLLDGSATGSRGGQPRHEVQLRTGFTKDGFGARLNADWQSGTRVDGGTPAETLFFDDFATFDLRLFANLGQMPDLVRDNRWLRGTRVTLAVSNLFNARLGVRDAAGVVPLGYQPALLDPVGRSVRVELRKLF